MKQEQQRVREIYKHIEERKKQTAEFGIANGDYVLVPGNGTGKVIYISRKLAQVVIPETQKVENHNPQELRKLEDAP